MSHNNKQLTDALLARSSNEVRAAATWEAIKSEWALMTIRRNDKGACACGHRPIRNKYFVINEVTDEFVVLGSICVEPFLQNGAA